MEGNIHDSKSHLYYIFLVEMPNNLTGEFINIYLELMNMLSIVIHCIQYISQKETILGFICIAINSLAKPIISILE